MADDTLKTLYVDELRDLLDAEEQLIKAIPKMAEASTSDALRSGFEQHLEQTKNHASRIEQILEALGEAPKGKKCRGMQGIVAEGKGNTRRGFRRGANGLGDHFGGTARGALRNSRLWVRQRVRKTTR